MKLRDTLKNIGIPIWKFFGFILICALTIYIKSEWATLLIILYLAYFFKLIDNNFIENLNKLKQAWQGNYKEEDLTNKEKQEKRNNNKIESSDYEKVIFWFKYNKGINFNSDKKITNSDQSILPDGIAQSKSYVRLLEIKHFMGSQTITRGIEQLKRYKDFYNDSTKNIELYFGIIIDKEEDLDKLNNLIKSESIKDLNLNIYVFIYKGNNIELLK